MAAKPTEPGNDETRNPDRPSSVRRYDFRTARKLTPAQRVKLGAWHSRLAGPLAVGFTAGLHVESEASFLGLEQVQVSALPAQPGAVHVEITLKPGGGRIYLTWPRELAFYLIERVLGGTGDDLFLDKELSDFEKGIIRRFSEMVFQALRNAFEKGTAPDGVCGNVREDQESFGELFPYEILLMASLNIRLAERQGKLTLVYPYNVIKAWLDQPGSVETSGAGSGAAAEPPANSLPDGLKQAAVDVRVRMASTVIKLADFSSLQVGDCLQLNHAVKDPFQIYVEGRPKFQGHLGMVGGQRGIKISQAHPAGPEPRS